MFESIFRNQLLYITSDDLMADKFWSEIVVHYNNPQRYYHTLDHLNSLTSELLTLKKMISDWTTIVFSIAYHDIIYNPLKNDNEEKSAELAMARLAILNLPIAQINKCKEQILATKSHRLSDNRDTNYFTDADLAILGAGPNSYKTYAEAIRKEYKFYPDLVYNPGRRKVLKHFLNMNSVYKTDHFRHKYEAKARENMEGELRSIS